MKTHPFSLSIDGSNDTDLKKIYPLTVRIYDVSNDRVGTRFLDMCFSSSSTAEGISSVLDGKLKQLLELDNPWSTCTSVGVDNTSVNIGILDSLKTRVLRQNSVIYFMDIHAM